MIEFQNRSGTNVEATEADRAMLHDVQQFLSHVVVTPEHSACLVDSDGTRIPLPDPLFKILRAAAAMLVRGERLTLAPVTKELSSQEGADLLGVSRPHFIKLLDEGLISFTKTGRNRRVKFGDVIAYQKQRDAMRKQILRDMIKRNEELGAYDTDEFEIEPTR
jgi:excisionase family DNA binding protein